MICKEETCDRRAHSRGWCTSHYRRWRTGKPMDSPIRGYAEDAQEGSVAAPQRGFRRKRERPFAAEYALLQELGLYDEHRRRIVS